MLVAMASRAVQHRQKALEQMHLTLPEVVSEIHGKTGRAILHAILAGERDPQRLASHRDRRGKHDQATIAKALEGHWRAEHLLARRAGIARLLLCVLLGLPGTGLLAVGPHRAWARPGHRDAAVPFPPLHWKALLLAGDDAIEAFDQNGIQLGSKCLLHQSLTQCPTWFRHEGEGFGPPLFDPGLDTVG